MSECHAIVILGSPNDRNGQLSAIALSRCEKAIAVLEDNPTAKIICTGGFGEHFNQTQWPHARYCKQYLMGHGVPECRFLTLVESRFTFEDAILTLPVLKRHQISSIEIITSDFHMNRVQYIFDSIFSDLAVSYSIAHSEMDHTELTALIEHEKRVMQREEANVVNYFRSLKC